MKSCRVLELILIGILWSTDTLASLSNYYNDEGRIIGGSEIAIEKVPYQISLRENNDHFCGGSIISPYQIVTAAHCTSGKNASVLSIRAGSSKLDSGGQVVPVTKIINHPTYSDTQFDYDIAILELSSNLTFGISVAAIVLPAVNQTWPAKTQVLVTGWGFTTEDSQTAASVLQGVTVEIIDAKTCKSAYGSTLSSNMICAGVSGGGKDACQEDSGGPLEVDGLLVGVVSFGNGCGRPGFPGIYASVAAFRAFIKESTGL